MTKEALLARKAQLEGEIAQQRGFQAAAKSDIERLTAQASRARDLENSLGGALQDVEHWLGVVEKAASEAALMRDLDKEAKEPTKQ